MKTFNFFVVELEKPINDTIKTESGLELFVETKFENSEFEYRVTEGPVVACPFNCETGVEDGDTMYFHHLVVMQGGQPLTGFENHYIVNYNDQFAVSNQAIAYKSKKDNKIRPMFGWALLEPVEDEDALTSDTIEIVSLKEHLPTKARIAFHSDELSDIGAKVGDVVGFKENRDYRITIDGKEYYRTRIEDLMYVEEEVHND